MRKTSSFWRTGAFAAQPATILLRRFGLSRSGANGRARSSSRRRDWPIRRRSLRRLIGDPRLKTATRLDTVVVTIDAVIGLSNLDRHPVASRQCALADQRVITKSDIAEPAVVQALKRRLRALNPGAEIAAVGHGRVDAEALLSASLYNARACPDVDRWLGIAAHRAHARDHGGDHDHLSHAARTWLLEAHARVDWEAFSRRLGDIIGRRGESLLRIKGVVHTTDDPRPIVIHGVQRMFHQPVRLNRWTTPPGTKIVVISDADADVAVAEIRNALGECAETPASNVHRGAA